MEPDIVRETFITIDDIVNDEEITQAARIAQLKIAMNNVDDIEPFRRHEKDEQEMSDIEKEVNIIFADLILIEDDAKKMHLGVEAGLRMKKIKKQLQKTIDVTSDSIVKSKAEDISYVADHFLEIIYFWACGMKF